MKFFKSIWKNIKNIKIKNIKIKNIKIKNIKNNNDILIKNHEELNELETVFNMERPASLLSIDSIKTEKYDQDNTDDKLENKELQNQNDNLEHQNDNLEDKELKNDKLQDKQLEKVEQKKNCELDEIKCQSTHLHDFMLRASIYPEYESYDICFYDFFIIYPFILQYIKSNYTFWGKYQIVLNKNKNKYNADLNKIHKSFFDKSIDCNTLELLNNILLQIKMINEHNHTNIYLKLQDFNILTTLTDSITEIEDLLLNYDIKLIFINCLNNIRPLVF